MDSSTNSETKSCPQCGEQLDAAALKCHACGAFLYCAYCGKKHDAGGVPKACLPCFGSHLVSQGLVTDAQLLRALNRQRREQLAIGELAIRRKLMSVDQVLMVLNLQATRHKRFGKLAVELGFLTPDDVEELLVLQRTTRPPIGELLVAQNSIPRSVMEEELVRFRGTESASLRPPVGLEFEPDPIGKSGS